MSFGLWSVWPGRKARLAAHAQKAGKAWQSTFFMQTLIAIGDPAAQRRRLLALLGVQARAQCKPFALRSLHQLSTGQSLPLAASGLVANDLGFGVVKGLELEQAGKFDEAAETRINLSTAFALVDSWSFDDELTLENFIELLQCDELKGVAAQVIQKIDRAASDPDSFVKKKSPSLSTGSSESGSLTAAPGTKTSKRAAKA